MSAAPNRRPHVAPTIHDPGIEIGPFRILQRTDGAWIAYDEREPVGRRTAFRSESEQDVANWARRSLTGAAR